MPEVKISEPEIIGTTVAVRIVTDPNEKNPQRFFQGEPTPGQLKKRAREEAAARAKMNQPD
jgi:hypothetical protein